MESLKPMAMEVLEKYKKQEEAYDEATRFAKLRERYSLESHLPREPVCEVWLYDLVLVSAFILPRAHKGLQKGYLQFLPKPR